MDSGLMNEVYLDTLTFIRVLSDSSWIEESGSYFGGRIDLKFVTMSESRRCSSEERDFG